MHSQFCTTGRVMRMWKPRPSTGFDPARDPASQEQFQAKTGFRYIPDSNRDQRREVNEAGWSPSLLRLWSRPDGTKTPLRGLAGLLRPMSLDREFDSAVKNALASLANWGNELCQAGKFEQAVNVIATGRALAELALLLNNFKAAWQQWAEATAAAGKDDKAIAILAACRGFAQRKFSRCRPGFTSGVERKRSKRATGKRPQPPSNRGWSSRTRLPKPSAPLDVRLADSLGKRRTGKGELQARGRGAGPWAVLHPKDERLTNNIIYPCRNGPKMPSKSRGCESQGDPGRTDQALPRSGRFERRRREFRNRHGQPSSRREPI